VSGTVHSFGKATNEDPAQRRQRVHRRNPGVAVLACLVTHLSLKTLHILSMVLLFGTGLGSAFYKWMADRSACRPERPAVPVVC